MPRQNVHPRLTREEWDREYESHNRRAKNWVHGSCGCGSCSRYRSNFIAPAYNAIQQATSGREVSMSSINVCEREGCDTFMKGEAVGAITLIYTVQGKTTDAVKTMELCPACVEDVHNVITTQPLQPRQKSYNKPFNPAASDLEDELADVSDEQLAAELLQRSMRKARAELESGRG